MSKVSKLNKSRNKWKTTAVDRGKDLRYARRENARLRRDRDKYKAAAKEANRRCEETASANQTPVVCSKLILVYIVLLLFCVARIGFRAISRVLGVLAGFLGLKKAPCHQTVIDIVCRLSISRIQNAASLLKTACPAGFIFIMDISIALGAGKILALLAVRADHYAVHGSAPALQDVHCVAVKVSASLTGEVVAGFLSEAIKAVGRPAAILKDAGTELAKSVNILGEQGLVIPSIADISHVIANFLKREYGNHPMLDPFLSACGKASKRLKQTILACMAPPKVSTKARFMNLHRLVEWAEKILKHSPPGKSAEGSIIEKLRKCLNDLPACKSFIKLFLRDAGALLKVQEILKNKGLSKETARECKDVLYESIPSSSPISIGMLEWMAESLAILEMIGLKDSGLPVTSDSIESLFGAAKIHGTGVVKDANRIALRIPALCGRITKEDAQNVLNVSVKEQKQVTGNLPSLTKQRREILPNPGKLESVLSDSAVQDLTMMPGAKNRAKNEIILNISNSFMDTNGPDIILENETISASDNLLPVFAATG